MKTKTIILKIKGEVGTIDRLLKFIDMLSWNGNIGHSSTFFMALDGDGWDRIEQIEPKPIKDKYEYCYQGSGIGELPYHIQRELREYRDKKYKNKLTKEEVR